jgi:ParB family chromosome partitioning protein
MVEILGRPAELAVADIRPNPHQPRRSFDPIALRDLTESIKTNGIIQPIVVRAVPGGGYELIAGERRWRACQSAGLTTIPAIIKEVDGLTQAQMALVENIQREDLPALERAGAYKALLSQLGLTQAELAARLGEDRSTVANFLRLLELPEPVRKHIREGRLSLGHAKLLAGVTDVLEQARFAELVVSQDLSVRNLERAIEAWRISAPPPPAKPKEESSGLSAHYAELEKSISRQLGMRVQLRAGRAKGKGKLTIVYGSLEQFDRLMEQLGVEIG